VDDSSSWDFFLGNKGAPPNWFNELHSDVGQEEDVPPEEKIFRLQFQVFDLRERLRNRNLCYKVDKDVWESHHKRCQSIQIQQTLKLANAEMEIASLKAKLTKERGGWQDRIA
jgi:hypothetical protein